MGFIVLYIIGFIVLLLTFLALLWVNIVIYYGDITKKAKKKPTPVAPPEIVVYVKILFFKKTIYTSAQTKRVKEIKEVSAETEKKLNETRSAVTSDIPDLIGKIKNITLVIIDRFKKNLHVTINKLHIKVATDDAAKTAITYGIASQGIAYLCEIIRNNTKKLTVKDRNSVKVFADFVGNKFDARINIKFKIRIFHILLLGLNVFENLNIGGSKNGRQQTE